MATYVCTDINGVSNTEHCLPSAMNGREPVKVTLEKTQGNPGKKSKRPWKKIKKTLEKLKVTLEKGKKDPGKKVKKTLEKNQSQPRQKENIGF